MSLRSAFEVSYAAYLGPRAAAYEVCDAIRPERSWGSLVAEQPISDALLCVNATLEKAGITSRIEAPERDLRE